MYYVNALRNFENILVLPVTAKFELQLIVIATSTLQKDSMRPKSPKHIHQNDGIPAWSLIRGREGRESKWAETSARWRTKMCRYGGGKITMLLYGRTWNCRIMRRRERRWRRECRRARDRGTERNSRRKRTKREKEYNCATWCVRGVGGDCPTKPYGQNYHTHTYVHSGVRSGVWSNHTPIYIK